MKTPTSKELVQSLRACYNLGIRNVMESRTPDDAYTLARVLAHEARRGQKADKG